MGVVIAPRRSSVFRHIEFLRLSDRRLLVIIVSPEGDADISQQAAEDDQRQREVLFMAVETGGDEGPDLVQHPGQSQQQTAHHQHFERDEEGREDADRDQLDIGRHVGPDRHRDQVDQARGTGPDRQQRHGDGDTVETVEQPVAQLHQVLDEGLFAAGELVSRFLLV